MNTNSTTRRQREILVLTVLALLSAGAFLSMLRVGESLVLAVLAIAATVLLFGLVSLLLRRNISAGRLSLRFPVRTEDENTPECDPHRWDDLPPAIRKRMRGSMYFPAGGKDPTDGFW